MQKRFAVSILLLALCSFLAFGESYAIKGMLNPPNSLIANAGLGLGYSTGIGVGGGIEYVIGAFKIDEKLPFTYGAAGRAGLALGVGRVDISAGVLGTVHFAWSSLDLPEKIRWLSNLDSYIGIGIAILPSPNLSSIGGSSYFLSKNLAINLEGGLSASYIGLLFKL
ncbi:MAG: hypothetical protein WCQ50_10175 [Spirochaetota bacterium]